MKKIRTGILALFFASGLHALAEETASPSKDTDAVNSTAATEEAAPIEKSKPAKKSKRNIKNNLFYGGYINLSFGDYTVIGIEPMIGYRVSPKFSAGVKVRYDYIKDDRYNTSRTTSTYGGSIFGRYLVTPKFYAQAEAASYNYEYFNFNGGSERDWVPFVFLGGGFIQPLSERTWLNVQILFDVLQDDGSPYDDWQPFFSIGVGAGF